MTHEIELEGYYPKIFGSPMRMLCLGTKASYGMEVLHFRRGTGWDGLALDVTFTLDPQAEGTTVLADAGDTVAVPPAATAQATNSGSVTVRGVRDGVQCISCNIPYLVLNHAPVPGQQTDPAESVWKQYADKLIPAGGSTGQVLAKASAQDMDLYWADGTTTQTETTPHMLTNAGRSKKKAIVSFVDDDCRSEAYTVLFPLVQELGMPYTVACPAGLMGKNGRMTVEQLQEMARSGVTVACHTMTETDMEQDTPETLEATLQQFEAEMRRWGIRGVRSYAYVNGRYKADCLNTVKKHFDLGLTVEKGVNQIPYESCRMKRVEVFPKNKSYTLEDVKAWVDKTVQDGGWLILMTHAWYTTFDAAQLKELVGYIRASGAELMDLYDALDATGNVVEAGDYQKPGADAAEPFFVVDADGRAWTNALENLRPADGITNVGAALQSGYVISTATGKAIKTSDTGFRVTQPVDVTSAAQVLVTAWAYTGFALYSFFDAAGTCLAVKAADADYAAGGNTLTRQAVAVPQGAATLIVAGNLYQALPAVRLVSAANLVQQVKSMTVAWHANYVLKISGSTVNYASENRRISEKVAAAAGDTYRLSCSANWNNALYVIYAADNSVLACRQAPNNAAGEVLTDFAVTMPENTAYFRVAANLEIQPESYAVARYTTRIAAKAPVLTVAAVRTLLDILRAGTYTQSQQSAIQNLENALLIID